jgi:phenylacetate-CoA ligase
MYLPPAASRLLIRAVDAVQRRGVHRLYERLEAMQWWPPEKLRELQREKLAARVMDAAEHSPLIGRRLREAGVDPRSLSGPEDLVRVPILEREDLREHGGELTAHGPDAAGALPNSTGGSTGSNVPFFVDRECWRWRDAVDLRLWSFLGLAPGARVATIWGAPMDLDASRRLRTRGRLVVDNRRFFSAYRLDGAAVDRLLDWLARARPDVLMGYASVLDLLARRAAARGGMECARKVLSSAEMLFPDQRARIAAGLGAEVFDLYGCREVGLVALECPEHRGLHVMDERLVVERLPATDVGGAPQEILVTDLDNRATPFLRYRIGDTALAPEPGACPCGRGLSRMGGIGGRAFDVIRSASGRAVGGTFWSLLLRTAVSGVETFRVVQKAPDLLEIQVTPEGALDGAKRAVVTAKVKEALGDAVVVTFVETAALEPLPSGKHRFVVALPPGAAGEAALKPGAAESSGAAGKSGAAAREGEVAGGAKR